MAAPAADVQDAVADVGRLAVDRRGDSAVVILHGNAQVIGRRAAGAASEDLSGGTVTLTCQSLKRTMVTVDGRTGWPTNRTVVGVTCSLALLRPGVRASCCCWWVPAIP